VSRKDFWGMLKKLKQQGITILVSTPYMDEAALCDRIALINKGKILQINTPENITANYPRPLYAAESNDNYSLLKELRQNPKVRSAYIFGEAIHVTLNEQLTMNNEQFMEITPTIEDCFIELLKE